MPIKNPLDLDSNVIDMNSYLSRYTHANYRPALPKAGYAILRERLHFLRYRTLHLLDNLGYVWTSVLTWPPDGFLLAYAGCFPSTLPRLKFPRLSGQSVLLHE